MYFEKYNAFFLSSPGLKGGVGHLLKIKGVVKIINDTVTEKV